MIKAASIKRVSREIERGIKKQEAALAKGMVRGLNKSATSVRKISSDEVRATLRVKAGYVKRLLSVRRAKRGNPRMAIGASYKPIPITEFTGARQTRKGVTVKMRKDKPRKLFAGAFIQKVGSGGHVGAFRRKKYANRWSKGRPRTSSPNLPIQELHGPAAQTVFVERLPDIQRRSDPVVDKNLNREIAFALSQR